MRAVYAKLVILGLLIIGPAASAIIYNDYQRLNRLLDQQLTENIKIVSAQIHDSLPLADDVHERFEGECRRAATSYNQLTGSGRIVQAGLYKRSEQAEGYRLVQTVSIDRQSSSALISVADFGGNALGRLRRIDQSRYTCAVALTPGRSAEYVLFFQAVDDSRAAFLHQAIFRKTIFWSIAFASLLVFIAVFILKSEFSLPMSHLIRVISGNRKTAIDPGDFGALADVARAIEDIRRAEENTADDPFIDSTTGWGTEDTAKKIFEDIRQLKEECYATLFSVNFAAEYVRAFGRANQGLIKKLTAQALDATLPKSAPKSLPGEDYLFLSRLSPQEFQTISTRALRTFNESILTLYELGQGKQVPIQTLSIFAISNRATEVETIGQAVDRYRRQWSVAIEERRGGWAILDAGGNIENSAGQTKPADSFAIIETAATAYQAEESAESGGEPSRAAAGHAAAPVPPAAAPVQVNRELAEDAMDPVLARKMFIVKLCRLSGIKPRLAAQMYSAGWRKPDVLLQTKIHELTERAGIESHEAADMIANLRKVPKEKFSYADEDYRDVFVTDVRMIRKIPRESLDRWFVAGFRRVEDLKRATAQELAKLDAGVPAEDIDAVLAGIRGSAAK